MANRVAVIPFIRSETHQLADTDTVNCLKRKVLITPVGSPTDNRQKVTLPINYNTPFETINTMFSRVSAVFLTPFFDFTTEASR